jgi:hypothetical protein
MSIVLLTCFGMGGGTVSMLKRLKIPHGDQTVEPSATEKAKLAAQYSLKVSIGCAREMMAREMIAS